MDVANIPVPATPAGTFTQTYTVTGWAWWLLVNLRFSINNIGGALVISPLVQVDVGSLVTWTLPGSVDVAAGAVGQVCFVFNASRQTAIGGVQSQSLGFIPTVDEARITYGGNQGDANTSLTAGMITIVGKRHRNRK